MDFKDLKQKAIKLKDDTLEVWVKKLSESSFTISKKQDLEDMIKASATTSFTSKDTWETKTYKHKSFVIFADVKSDFFKELLYIFPIILTKAFSQSIKVKLAKTDIEWVKLEDYKVSNLPSLVIFEEEKVLKVIDEEEKILKLVKSLDLDINKAVENI